MKSNIIEKTLTLKVNNIDVRIRFDMYCNIIVISMYNDNTLSHQFGIKPNMFYNYEECKYELLFVINKFLANDCNLEELQDLDKDELAKVNNKEQMYYKLFGKPIMPDLLFA